MAGPCRRGARAAILSATFLTAVSVLAGAPDSALAAGALPAGGQYVSGKGSIAGAGAGLTVKQSSATGIIDWSGFSIGKGNSVTFDNGSGATLNRVTGANISNIAGSLNATGSVYLMNPEGVVIGPGGKIVTGGNFAVMTDIGNDKHGSVVDAGKITSQRGSVSLSGTNVGVSGLIAVNRGGHIWLTSSNTTSVSGSLNANNASGTAGSIVATGKTVNVAGTANISASGKTGGTILIGGDVHGGAIAVDNFVKQSVVDATTTTIGKGAKISANGLTGAGGDIVVWSNGQTTYQGTISATGKTSGGFAEVSSHDVLAFTGTADLLSANGKTGTLLLDPENVTISTAASSTDTCTAGTCKPTGDNSVLNVTTLQNALASASVDVTTGSSGSQTGDITVASRVTWSSNSVLTLDAYHSVLLDAGITISGDGGLAIKTNDGGTGGVLSFDLTLTGFEGDVAYTGTLGSGQSLTINGKSYTLVNNAGTLAGDIASNPAGAYALADNASGSTSVSTTFTGTFEGLGNKFTGLTDSLFADSSGTIRDIAVTGSFSSPQSIAGGLAAVNSGLIADSFSTVALPAGTNGPIFDYGGGLVGENSGQITNSFATGAIDANYAGGLVGENLSTGSISQSHATGMFSGTDDAGGLVGINEGTITQSFAGGATGAGADYFGGLVGENAGSISDSYAAGSTIQTTYGFAGGLVGLNESTGTVQDSYALGDMGETGGAKAGGVVGDNQNPSGFTNTYWDSNTSRIGGSSSGMTSLTTAQLQAGLPTGFSNAIWQIVPGQSFPYLAWQFVGTPVFISGIALDSPVTNEAVTLLNGTQIIPALSEGGYGNGYYYYAFSPGTIGATSQLVIYENGTASAIALAANITGSASGLNLSFKTLTETGNETSVSAFASDLAAAIGSNTDAQSLAHDATSIAISSSTSLTVDEPITYGTVSLAAASNLSIDDAVTADSTQDQPLVTLTAGGSITESGSGAITATELTGSSATGASLTGSNDIEELTNFTNASGNFALTNAGTLTVDELSSPGGIALATTGSGNGIAFDGYAVSNGTVDLVSAGTISQTTTNIIKAGTLEGSSDGAVTLNSANQIADLGPFTTSNGAFSLTDAAALTLDGTVNPDNGNLTLTTTGSGDGMTFDASLGSGGILDLVSAGAIIQNTGIIEAGTLTGSSVGGTRLQSGNYVADLGNFTNSTSGSFWLSGGGALKVTGDVSSTGDVGLDASVSNGTVTIDGTITAAGEAVVGGDSVTEAASGVIDAASLAGGLTVGTVTLTGTNHIGVLDSVSDRFGSFELTDAASLVVPGYVSVPEGDVTLTTTGSGHKIVIEQRIETADEVILDSASTITETGPGKIEASELSGSSVGGATLTGPNDITNLESFINSSGGGIALTNSGALTVAGPVSSTGDIALANAGALTVAGPISSTGNITLTTTGSGNGIAIDDTVTAANEATLTSAGAITETGAIDASELSGSSVGGATLKGANDISDLESFTNSTSSFVLTDAASLTVMAPVSSTGDLTLTTTGSGHKIAIDGKITASNEAVLDSASTIAETGSGAIDAHALVGSSSGTVSFAGANDIADLSTFSTAGGNFTLVDDASLTTTGTVDSGVGALDITMGTHDGLTIDSAVETAGTMNLVTGGEATESTSAGAIEATTLNVTAQTGIDLDSTHNDITKIGTDKTTSGPNLISQN